MIHSANKEICWMKTYIKVVLVVLSLCVVYGFVVPFLVSMRDSVAVFSGVVIAVFFGPLIGICIGKKLFKSTFNKGE